MRYRLIALDLDGTLLSRDQQVSRENAEAIARAQAAGVMVVPCTGRGWGESRLYLKDIDGLHHGVFNTGAVVVEMDSGRAVDLADFEPHLVMELVESLRHLPHAVLVYQEFSRAGCDYLITGDGPLREETQRWIDVNGLRVKENRNPGLEDLHHTMRVGLVAQRDRAFAVERQVLERFPGQVSIHCFAGVPTADPAEQWFIVEIFAASVNKWRGIQWLANHHGFAAEQIATVGDEINDLAMLESAGLGIAMGNAVPAAKKAANRITLPQAEHGVAHAIHQMLDGHW